MKKNQEFTVLIEDIGVNGEGIGKVDGYPLFIKDTVPGDVIQGIVTKTEKKYGYGKVLSIITPSPDRAEAVCPIAKRCGGCQLQDMSYERQLAYKREKVRNNLDRIGKLTGYTLHDTLGCERLYRYRNKAQFPIGKNKNGRIIAGFYAGRTHEIIECEDCVIGIEENKEILKIIIEHMEKHGIEPYDEKTHKGLVRHVLIRKGFATGEIMVSVVINGDKIKAQEELAERLVENIRGMKDISLNINKQRTNVILGNKVVTLYGDGYITDFIGDVKFRISPLSFYQVNPTQTKVLYGKALEYAGLTGEETVFDLYCGVGTISLFLAKSAKKVYGVEIVPQAIEDAKVNARINGIDNVEFFVGKAEEVIPDLYEHQGIRADVVVVDPPRKGCDERLLETIVMMEPKRVVYVSCDSATLARDLKYLSENGFKVEEVQPADMFVHGVHVETVVLLSHKILIKKATGKEAAMAAGLALQMWEENTIEGLTREFTDYINADNSIILLAMSEDKPIGFAQCGLRHDYVEGTDSSPVGYLEGIFVVKEYRKKGIAREMLKECEIWAREQGCKEFASDCELINDTSLTFHLKMGFKEANRIICFTKNLE